MTRIQNNLEEGFASLVEDLDDEEISQLSDSVPERTDRHFAKIDEVAPNGPAATAGLVAGDLIRNFGDVKHGNHERLRKVAECVQENEGVSVFPLLDTFCYGQG